MSRSKSGSTRRPIKMVLASIGLIAGLVLGAGSVSAQTGAIEGTVSDSATGAPIEGAFVMVRGGAGGGQHPGHGGGMVITDENGAYAIDDLEPGEYTIKCGARGYLRATLSAEVFDGQTTVQDIVLDPLAFGSVAGLVTEAATGLPIAGARVVLRTTTDSGGGPGGHWLTALTGGDGTYLIENAPAGDYEAQAFAFGYLPNDPVPVSVSDGETTTVYLELEQMAFGIVEGTVTDAVTGDPIEGARVSLRKVWGWEWQVDHEGHWHHALTDENGFYRIEDVEVAAYLMTVSANSYVRATEEIEVLEGQATIVNVDLSPLAFGGVEGTVTETGSGVPVEEALVVILPHWMDGVGGHGGWWMTRSDENGFYSFEEVPVGSYRMVALARGFRPAQAEIEIAEGQVLTVDFALETHDRPGPRSR